ncbi:sigma factor-like helix-turn-helix DNA-binding protein [Limnochorda pilosa]|uniref:RNA polymerase subunit sigma-70 n=1 Tax=Limnochorda pilosa TaxID=1555112 RepID=A0A0K2SQL0_LIMPI|nr:sigma-70 region 4 domain-containing protein [Limnochorda pilosa]BAS29391.1 RNA polymerase subunit sigma-70 [Limnochorda pilosa]
MQIEIRGAERLSFRERQVVALKEMGYGNQDVARRLGIGPASVATLYHRAKTKGYQVVIVLEGDPLGLFAPDDVSEENGAGEAGQGGPETEPE